MIFFGQTRLEISPVALLEPVRLTPKARPMRKKKREAQTTFHSFSHLCKKNEEKEEATSHHLLQLLSPLHLDVLEDDEAEEKAGDSSTDVCNHAVAGINVVVTPIGGVAEVESKEAND